MVLQFSELCFFVFLLYTERRAETTVAIPEWVWGLRVVYVLKGAAVKVHRKREEHSSRAGESLGLLPGGVVVSAICKYILLGSLKFLEKYSGLLSRVAILTCRN